MKDRYPRTVADFVETARLVIIECEDCRRKASLDLSLLELTFGADFDMYASMREMRNRLACPGCGSPRPIISFYDPHERAGTDVSFDESVTRSLEFSAYNRARAAS
jgi:hypothetical protein